jgi:hypothetical protein
MVRPTPFHERLREYNQGQLWTHWSGQLSALRYDLSAKHEYFAIRNSAASSTPPALQVLDSGTRR